MFLLFFCKQKERVDIFRSFSALLYFDTKSYFFMYTIDDYYMIILGNSCDFKRDSDGKN